MQHKQRHIGSRRHRHGLLVLLLVLIVAGSLVSLAFIDVPAPQNPVVVELDAKTLSESK